MWELYKGSVVLKTSRINCEKYWSSESWTKKRIYTIKNTGAICGRCSFRNIKYVLLSIVFSIFDFGCIIKRKLLLYLKFLYQKLSALTAWQILKLTFLGDARKFYATVTSGYLYIPPLHQESYTHSCNCTVLS